MPAAARRTVHGATNLLTATPDEAAIIIACALADPGDLLHLAAACRRFFIKCITAPPPPRGTVAAQQAEMWSIAEEAGRRWIAACTNQERGWVPRRGRGSWLGLMWEVESLRRRSAVFGRSHDEYMTLSEGGSVATRSEGGSSVGWSHGTAASKALMRAGRHYAQFTVVAGMDLWFGVIRPSWDVEGGKDTHWVDGHCFYGTFNGHRWPGEHRWEGPHYAREEGDRIGLLLDLDQGTMTVYKNDERLGVMATDLSGEYSWAVSLLWQCTTARIDAAEAPASPTVEAAEVAQAVAYEAAQAQRDIVCLRLLRQMKTAQ
jgi:hypothetical protein